jgi:hypothetical protein
MNLNTRSDPSLNFQRLNIYLLKKVVCLFLWFVGPYHIGSKFWKFYLIRTSFMLHELVSLVSVWTV